MNHIEILVLATIYKGGYFSKPYGLVTAFTRFGLYKYLTQALEKLEADNCIYRINSENPYEEIVRCTNEGIEQLNASDKKEVVLKLCDIVPSEHWETINLIILGKSKKENEV
jgi:hypothetical protein